MFRDSSHCFTSPPSHRRISTTSTQDLPQRDLHRGITTQHREYTTPLSQHKHLYTRGKVQSLVQSKKEIKLSGPMITNSLLVILKDHKQSFSQYKDPKDRFEMIAQVCEKIKCFGKETIKKTLRKNFLINM